MSLQGFPDQAAHGVAGARAGPPHPQEGHQPGGLRTHEPQLHQMDPGGWPGHRVRHQHRTSQDPSLNSQDQSQESRYLLTCVMGTLTIFW